MQILIVGAGTAGLASACLLARAGHQVSVIEAVAALAPVGAGLLIQPSGQQVLQKLGVLTELQALGSQVDALHGYNPKQQRVLDLDYRDIRCSGLGLHRAHLANALYHAAMASGVRFRFDQQVSVFSQQGDTVTVTVTRGDGECETLAANLLVIANGTRSQLREQLPIPCSVTAYPWGALWAICESEQWPQPQLLAQVYDGPGKMLGVLPSGRHPLSGRLCYSLFWSLPRARIRAWQEQPFAQWLDELRQFWPTLAPLLASLQREQVAWAEYSDVVMSRWHHGRVVCIGDAAHAMSPQLGQGANLALIDAYCLARAIANQPEATTALAEYSRMRQSHLQYYQRASRWLTPLYQSHLPLGNVRDWGTRLTRHLPFFYQQALHTLTGYKAGLLRQFAFPD